MVDTKRYTPSNKRFQKHTQSFVEGKTMKGHLSKGKQKDKEKGVLVRVLREKLYSDGWEVRIDKKILKCTYGDNIVYLPPYRTTKMYFIPTNECKVEINKKTKVIIKIDDPNKKPIQMNNDGVKLAGSGRSSLEITGDNIVAKGDNLEAENDIKVDTSKNDKVSTDQISVVDMYKEIQSIKTQISDKNG